MHANFDQQKGRESQLAKKMRPQRRIMQIGTKGNKNLAHRMKNFLFFIFLGLRNYEIETLLKLQC